MRINSIEEAQSLPDLSSAEKRFLQDSFNQTGCQLEDCDCPDEASDTRVVRAEIIRAVAVEFATKSNVLRGVQLEGAYISGNLNLSFCRLNSFISLENCKFEKEVDLRNIHMPQLSLNGSKICGLFAEGAIIGGDVFLRNGFDSFGEINFAGATIAGQFNCNGGQFNGNGGYAISIEGAAIKGDCHFNDGFVALGTVSISGARICGKIDCKGSSFFAEGGMAFNAKHAVIEQNFEWKQIKDVAGELNLVSAKICDLVDDISSWLMPKMSIKLDGFTYEHISSSFTETDQRIKVLDRGSVSDGAFNPQPFMQLAKIFSAMGHGGGARKVRLECQKRMRQYRQSYRRSRIFFINKILSTCKSPQHSWKDDLRDLVASLPLPIRTQSEGILSDFENVHHLQSSPVNSYEAIWTGKEVERRSFVWRILYMYVKTQIGLFVSIWSDRIARWTTGYGYAPERAFYAMFFFVFFASIVYHFAFEAGVIVPNSDVILTSFGWWWSMTNSIDQPALVWTQTSTARHYETFYGLAYAFDVFIPLVNIGQQDAWSSTTVTWFGWGVRVGTMFLEVVGWVVTALGAAAVTGVIKRD